MTPVTGGQFSIIRLISADDDVIQIQLKVPGNPKKILILNTTPEQFALAITGLGARPCLFNINEAAIPKEVARNG